MKLTKMLAAVAVTSTVIAAMAMSASAAFNAEYVAPTGDQTGKVTLTDLSPATGDHTLLVLNKDVFGDFTDGEEGTVTVNAADIVQIDQASTFDTVVVGDLAADIDAANQKLLDDYAAIEEPTPEQYDSAFTDWKASQTYYVRVGGGSTIDTAQITVNTTKVNSNTRPEETTNYKLGDVDGDGELLGGDATLIYKHIAGTADLDDTAMLAADVDGDGELLGGDATLIYKHIAGTATIEGWE